MIAIQKIKAVSRQHTEFINIDQQIQECVRESGVTQGCVQIFVPHTTAGIIINENTDPDVVVDMVLILERAVPWEGGYAHAEGNAAAPVRASMMLFQKCSLCVDGQLQFGTWQFI